MIGLTSRGPTPCGRPDAFGINTRVKMFLEWIKEKTGDNFQARKLDALSNGARTNYNAMMYFAISLSFFLVR